MFHTSYAQISIKDDILYLIYRPNLILNISVAQKVVTDRLVYQQNKAYSVLCETSGIIRADVEALDYLASEGTIFIDALAILCKTPCAYLLSKFYVETHIQEIPTAVFENKFQALNFLKKEKRRNK